MEKLIVNSFQKNIYKGRKISTLTDCNFGYNLSSAFKANYDYKSFVIKRQLE